MAKNRNTAEDETTNTAPNLGVVDGGKDDNTEWTSDDVPRVSIGEGTTKQGVPRVASLTGRYLYSVRQRIKRRMTVLHRFYGRAPGMDASGEFLVYGSGAINNKIALLPADTKVKLTYTGTKDVGEDSEMKMIKVEWPRGTRLLGKPNIPSDIADTDDGDDIE